MSRVLVEAVVVAAVGAALAFAANAVSPRGLKLSRDFFGSSNRTTTNLPPVTNLTASAAAVQSTNTMELLIERLRAKGISLADSNKVIQLYHDPRLDQNQVLFVDAREDGPYQQGHIPGAYQFDYYRPENYLAALLPLCALAQEIVVYCHGGGHCEDSEFAADFLVSAGVGREKILVYGGGIVEWETNGLPVEVGPRLSGQIRSAKP